MRLCYMYLKTLVSALICAMHFMSILYVCILVAAFMTKIGINKVITYLLWTLESLFRLRSCTTGFMCRGPVTLLGERPLRAY